jgi:translation initiation factor IF-2
MPNTNTKKENMIPRPPIVAVMGHIDHGKSTLLDYLRKSQIVLGEAGGITQHIGAYEIERDSKKITFLDTPGHEAFVAVRERGARIADIGILMVSAEDGVKPQTLEALKSIQKSEIPFIIAINKIDSPKANVDLTKSSLIENEIYLEGMGGNISFVEISAKNGTGVEGLLDLILLTAEIENMQGDPKGKPEGYVIESHKCKKRGISATLVLKNGTLNKGQFVATKSAYSPARSIENESNELLDTVTFSTPFTVCGFSSLPQSGEKFEIFDNKKDAEKYILENKSKAEITDYSLGEKEGETTIPLVIKADVVGSKEAIEHEIKKLNLEGINFKFLKSETGEISENDLQTALTNEKTLVIGFNVAIDNQAKQIIERNNVTAKVFNIIYEVTDWVKEEAILRKVKITVEEEIGKAKILKIFGKNKNLQIIGAKVKEGRIESDTMIKILRRNEEIDKGKIKGMQKAKNEATFALEEEEFGAAIECKVDLAESDMIYAYKIVEK